MKPEYWIAWCPHCGNVRQFGGLFRQIGWPICDGCKVTTTKDPRWPGTPWKWVPPEAGNEDVMRVWLDKEVT